jgi:hypothetical protein
LLKLLKESGHQFSLAADLEIVRGIKESLGFLSLDYDLAMMDSHTSK